ncbi:MAG: GNAT family N-acetyltransferase [Alphaproteobacteria bacterium]|nr:GNAT family N-acetyltransferase [Alphaproteobacteria bacterium]
MTDNFTISSITSTTIDAHLTDLANLLKVNVEGGASVSFILPFSQDQAAAFWVDKIKPSLQAVNCILLVAMVDNELAGCVMLDYDMPANQPHRADIAKLLVHPKFRRRGIARALMVEIEQQAIEQKRSTLVLDTANKGAEILYESLGYQPVGSIPNFGLNAQNLQLEPTTIMYKLL